MNELLCVCGKCSKSFRCDVPENFDVKCPECGAFPTSIALRINKQDEKIV